jgi:Asp-tRNA(Asn)/Glu-tRNA(Gln) amidotransferase A subunit family amidase
MRTCVGSTSVLRSIQQTVANKQQSAVEVTQTYLAQLKSVEGKVNAFLTVDEQAALAQVSLAASTPTAATWRQVPLRSVQQLIALLMLLGWLRDSSQSWLQAAAIDAAIARGEPAGALAGVPIAIKVRATGDERRANGNAGEGMGGLVTFKAAALPLCPSASN